LLATPGQGFTLKPGSRPTMPVEPATSFLKRRLLTQESFTVWRWFACNWQTWDFSVISQRDAAQRIAIDIAALHGVPARW